MNLWPPPTKQNYFRRCKIPGLIVFTASSPQRPPATKGPIHSNSFINFKRSLQPLPVGTSLSAAVETGHRLPVLLHPADASRSQTPNGVAAAGIAARRITIVRAVQFSETCAKQLAVFPKGTLGNLKNGPRLITSPCPSTLSTSFRSRSSRSSQKKILAQLHLQHRRHMLPRRRGRRTLRTSRRC